MTESKSNLVAADVSPQDAMPHQRARKFRELCALPPSPGGEGRGEGERFLQSHFRRKRLITQNPKSEIRNPKSIRASLRRLLRSQASGREPMQNSPSTLGTLASFSEPIGFTVVFLAFVFFSGCRTSEAAVPNTAKPASRPNFVFILTDDQRFDSMGCAGNRLIRSRTSTVSPPTARGFGITSSPLPSVASAALRSSPASTSGATGSAISRHPLRPSNRRN